MEKDRISKDWKYTKEVIFERLDRKMKDEQLYLDYRLTLPVFSKMTGTNRTYASRVICEKYKGFREYLNSLRIEKLLSDIQEERCAGLELKDPDEFANSYGFRTRRSLDRILVKETGCTYRKILRRRNRSK